MRNTALPALFSLGIGFFIGFNPQAAEALFVGAAALVAALGLSIWKTQMRGKNEYEIARRVLKAALQLRDAVRYVRNPFVSVGETSRAVKNQRDSGESWSSGEVTKDEERRAVYVLRWQKVTEAKTNLEAELLEAEVSWGSLAVEAQEDLDALVRRLYVAVLIHIRGQETDADEKILYETSIKDDFGAEISAAIEKIKIFLRPHLG